jgi:hypothetical protein
MTREEQIKAASAAYTRVKCPMAIGGDRFKNMIDSINANPAFIAGAEWADANQPNPWISVEDKLPEIGTVILEAYTIVVELQGVRHEDESIIVSRYDGEFVGDGRVEQMMGGTTCGTTHHWMPIPELPKEE